MSRTWVFAVAAVALSLAAGPGRAAPPGTTAPRFHFPAPATLFSPMHPTQLNYYAPTITYPRYSDQGPYLPTTGPYRYPQGLAPVNPYYPTGSYADLALLPPAVYRRPAPMGPAPAQIDVRVPAGAELWFGDTKTGGGEALRRFETPPLESGKKYGYDVRARWKEDGKEVERKLHVSVAAGGVKAIDFTRANPE